MGRIAFAPVLAFALVAPAAHAGGWATVELDRPPAGITAGTPWHVELVVKQHGITPLDDAAPSVRIEGGDGVARTFHARRTGRPGTYVADVTFPSAGTWRTRIYDGWTDAVPHRLSPVTVAGGAAGGGFPWEQAAAIALVALLWIGGWIALSRRPRPRRWGRSTFTLRERGAA